MVRYLLETTNHRIRCYSRGEHRQNDLANDLSHDTRLTFVLGDVRDKDSLTTAAEGCSAIFHAAALKTVGSGEANPAEFIHTNVIGTENVIAAARATRVARTLLISSDKSCQAINLYGSTKHCAESLMAHANRLGAASGCRFASVRGGNVWASNGSVAVLWRAARARGERLPVYGADSTRFHVCLRPWIEFAWRAACAMRGGEIFVPPLPAWRLGDLAEAFAPGAWDDLGRRPGDKEHELLVSAYEAPRTVDLGWAYAVEPSPGLAAVWGYAPWAGPTLPGPYSSHTARRMTPGELRKLVEAL